MVVCAIDADFTFNFIQDLMQAPTEFVDRGDVSESDCGTSYCWTTYGGGNNDDDVICVKSTFSTMKTSSSIKDDKATPGTAACRGDCGGPLVCRRLSADDDDDDDDEKVVAAASGGVRTRDPLDGRSTEWPDAGTSSARPVRRSSPTSPRTSTGSKRRTAETRARRLRPSARSSPRSTCPSSSFSSPSPAL